MLTIDGVTLDRAWWTLRLRAINRRIARMESWPPHYTWTAHDHDVLDELRAEAATLVMQLVNDDTEGGE